VRSAPKITANLPERWGSILDFDQVPIGCRIVRDRRLLVRQTIPTLHGRMSANG
jgi:hypothetical protein